MTPFGLSFGVAAFRVNQRNFAAAQAWRQNCEKMALNGTVRFFAGDKESILKTDRAYSLGARPPGSATPLGTEVPARPHDSHTLALAHSLDDLPARARDRAMEKAASFKALHEELIPAALRRSALHGSEGARVRRLAAAWGTNDSETVKAVIEAIEATEDEPTFPHNASKIFLLRNMEARHCDVDRMLLFNNPVATARIADLHELVPTETFFGIGLHPRVKKAGNVNRSGEIPHLPNGSLNFLLRLDPRAPNLYEAGNAGAQVSVLCTLDQVLQRKGRIHRDTSAVMSGAVVVEMPRTIGLPFKLAGESATS